MKTRILVPTALFLASTAALTAADTSFVGGEWVGTASFHNKMFPQKKIVSCGQVALKFEGDQKHYRFLGAKMQCEGIPSHDQPEASQYDVRDNGGIYFNDAKVGQVEGNTLHIANPMIMGSEQGVDDYTIRREGDVLIFTEFAGVPGKTPWYSFVAVMEKAAN
jgi:hypothetical protein